MIKCDNYDNSYNLKKNGYFCHFQGMGFLRKWLKEEYNNEELLFFQPHMVQLVLMKYVTMHSLHK